MCGSVQGLASTSPMSSSSSSWRLKQSPTRRSETVSVPAPVMAPESSRRAEKNSAEAATITTTGIHQKCRSLRHPELCAGAAGAPGVAPSPGLHAPAGTSEPRASPQFGQLTWLPSTDVKHRLQTQRSFMWGMALHSGCADRETLPSVAAPRTAAFVLPADHRGLL